MQKDSFKFISGKDSFVSSFIHHSFIAQTLRRAFYPQEQEEAYTDCIFLRAALQGGADAPLRTPARGPPRLSGKAARRAGVWAGL